MAKLARSDFPHPISASYLCEICGKEVSDVDVKSYILALAMPGKNGVIGAFGCKAEQHFGCCEAHAWEALVACHDEHLLPEHNYLHTTVGGDADKFAQVQALRASQVKRPSWRLK